MEEQGFRRLNSSEVDAAYAIYSAAYEWLRARGIRQWIVPIRRPVFDQWREAGELYGVFAGSVLAVMLCLHRRIPNEWSSEIAERDIWWLHTFAAAQEFRGRGVAKAALDLAWNYVLKNGCAGLWLDCIDGRLNQFYINCGFECMTLKTITYAPGIVLPMALMRKGTSRQS